MQLLVIQNGVTRSATIQPLREGAIGNAQTIKVMLPIIREDVAQDLALRKFTEALITECDRSFECRVGKLFEFAKAIRYDNDPIDVERIADAATTIQEGWGDCGDKTILLATTLGSIGYLSRLVKVNFQGDLAEHGYDHLYLEVQNPHTGEWVPLDATPENAPMGWESWAAIRDVTEIWGPGSGFSGILDGLLQQGINTGFNLGSQLLGNALRQGQASGAQADAIGHSYDTAAIQLRDYLSQIQTAPTVDQVNQAAAMYQALAQYATQHGNISYVVGQWQQANSGFQTWIQGVAAKLTPAASQQQGSVVPGVPVGTVAGAAGTVNVLGLNLSPTMLIAGVVGLVGLIWLAKS